MKKALATIGLIAFVVLLLLGIRYLLIEIDKMEHERLEVQSQLLVNFNRNIKTEEMDTSDWLTYRNEEYGFEVKYPKDWQLENEILYSPEMFEVREGGPYSLLIKFNDSKMNIDEYIKDSQECLSDLSWQETKTVKAKNICMKWEPTVYLTRTDSKLVEGISYSFNDESRMIIEILSTIKLVKKFN